jgi:esterase
VTAVAGDGSVPVGGLDLAYRCWGRDGTRLPVVLVHGAGGCANHWAPIAMLLASDRRCVALDQRGHGASTWSPDGDYRHARFVDDLDGFVTALGIGRATFVGFSMGCAYVTALAARRPELAGRAVLIEWSPDVGLGDAAYGLASRRVTASDVAFDRRLINGTGQRETILERRTVLWDCVRALRCPTLVVRGGRSPLFSAEQADTLLGALRDGHSVAIAGLGHGLSRRVADDVAAAIDVFDRL